MEYPNLTQLSDLGFSLYIESYRYGDGLLAGIDFPLNTFGKYTYYGRESVSDYISIANSPGDIEADEAYWKLYEYAKAHESFLFITDKTLENCLEKLEERAGKWLNLDYEQQEELLNNFIEFRA